MIYTGKNGTVTTEDRIYVIHVQFISKKYIGIYKKLAKYLYHRNQKNHLEGVKARFITTLE